MCSNMSLTIQKKTSLQVIVFLVVFPAMYIFAIAVDGRKLTQLCVQMRDQYTLIVHSPIIEYHAPIIEQSDKNVYTANRGFS